MGDYKYYFIYVYFSKSEWLPYVFYWCLILNSFAAGGPRDAQPPGAIALTSCHYCFCLVVRILFILVVFW